MIPPCDPSILDHNPQFQRLYETLTTSILNPDASTRAQSKSSARTAVGEIQSSKKRIKERMLRQLAFAPDSSLPAEYHDNLTIITLYLETPTNAIELDTPNPDTEAKKADDALSLLAPDIEAFYSNLPAFISAFSNTLSSAIQDLRALANADTDTAIIPDADAPAARSNHHARARARDRRVRTSMAPVPLLSSQLQARMRALRQMQLSDLPVARRKMAATAAEVVDMRARVLERTVVTLERAKHGALARATKAKAEHLALVAQNLEGKLEVTKLEVAATLYTPETIAALTRYRQHLRQTKERLEDQRKVALEELRAYGDVDAGPIADFDVDEGSFAEIARQYGYLARELETVKRAIALEE
ncbi:uncharacterized protein N7515_003627 [Penicillium bovifimosum]|uniref:Uncharacterized protein n=1 Tax=Penicillium bovifimosum TaxID=126998 RepID=A0A9W9L5W7_9EURO|nr:uncharacterized protein N7515_003627 [Penicillium bovifimosum]KAJ5138779.1 hypothetical protein N7515_003627 [Penicillium bovifimosum]